MNNSFTKQDGILALIESVLSEVDVEMAKGAGAIDSPRSLTYIRSRLEEIGKMIRTRSIIKDERSRGFMSYFVVDRRPKNHPLGTRITKIEYEFYRLQ